MDTKRRAARQVDGPTHINPLTTCTLPVDADNCPDLAMPGWTEVYASGQWVPRYEGDWRDAVDLAADDRATVYAAGRVDGYRLAWAEIGELHRLLIEWLEVLP